VAEASGLPRAEEHLAQSTQEYLERPALTAETALSVLSEMGEALMEGVAVETAAQLGISREELRGLMGD
jgi:hypothetical protein